MKTSIKLVIALSAAIWMIPIPEALAGIDITAGDWKVDFSGNVNGFYVGATCDHGIQHCRHGWSRLHGR